MKLINEIIELAVDDKTAISTLLRKCLVLSYDLKNDRLKIWVEKELNGYKKDDELPEYRKCTVVAKGLFFGSFGAEIRDQPLPPAVLKKEHRHFAESAVLVQPIISYERIEGTDTQSKPVIQWPADLTLMYQSKFIEGYALNRAWQEIPNSVFPALIDTVRTRILRFTLEIKNELGLVSDDLTKLPKEQTDRYVTNYIFGGNNVISTTASHFSQIGNIAIEVGDLDALSGALLNLGIKDPDLAELKAALDLDAKEQIEPSFGQRTLEWLKGVGSKLGKAGMDIGVEVAKQEIKKCICQYLGIPSDTLGI